MCIEADPNKCHRGDWMTADLEKLGVKVIHLGKMYASRYHEKRGIMGEIAT